MCFGYPCGETILYLHSPEYLLVLVASPLLKQAMAVLTTFMCSMKPDARIVADDEEESRTEKHKAIQDRKVAM
jgi:hypothetical protein